MTYVFVSYARKDQHLAQQVVHWLESRGYPLWWDQMLRPGDPFAKALTTALNEAACAIVIWTDNSIASDHVLDEAERARRARCLIPLAPPNFDLHQLPMGFGALQTIELFDWDRLAGQLLHFGFGSDSLPRRSPTIGQTLAELRARTVQRLGLSAIASALSIGLAAAFPEFALGIVLGAAAAIAAILAITS